MQAHSGGSGKILVTLRNWMFNIAAELSLVLKTPLSPPRVSRVINNEASNTFPRPRGPSVYAIPSLVISEPAAVPGFIVTDSTSNSVQPPRLHPPF